ncbi:ADP-ribosylation factor-like protein 11 [Protopterus annectens]|uniref:ADP-ribosylation factor-like protein 11 n=1 Tax=Protopterus annectens TaxID=7888 RepID=UPI001CFC1745|nr:ADP-ribosylation factor-like protein 11 [Protopterus annectens]XP_043940492.1 ADP-ribosylation factor-like protein 11 [Protopterus annectens]
MGVTVSQLHEYLASNYSEIKTKVILLGLDNAGKTTILYRLKLNRTIGTIPTIGFNVETLEPIQSMSLIVWDLNYGAKRKHLWKVHFRDADGLLFALDSADSGRFDEARTDLKYILEDTDMRMVPFVVLANKQDIPGAKSPSELLELLDLEKFQSHMMHVQGCCAVTGDGLMEAVQRLVFLIKENKRQRMSHR